MWRNLFPGLVGKPFSPPSQTTKTETIKTKVSDSDSDSSDDSEDFAFPPIRAHLCFRERKMLPQNNTDTQTNNLHVEKPKVINTVTPTRKSFAESESPVRPSPVSDSSYSSDSDNTLEQPEITKSVTFCRKLPKSNPDVFIAKPSILKPSTPIKTPQRGSVPIVEVDDFVCDWNANRSSSSESSEEIAFPTRNRHGNIQRGAFVTPRPTKEELETPRIRRPLGELSSRRF